MKIPDYRKAEVALTTKNVMYRAWADGTGYSKGDLLCKTVQMNADTLVPTGVENWTNVDTQTVIAAPPVADVLGVDEKDRAILGSETVTIAAAAASANPLAAIPAGANLAEVSVVESGAGVGGDVLIDVGAAVDNTATPKVGHPINCGSKFELENADEINNFAAQVLDAAGDDASLHVTYYCQFGQGNV